MANFYLVQPYTDAEGVLTNAQVVSAQALPQYISGLPSNYYRVSSLMYASGTYFIYPPQDIFSAGEPGVWFDPSDLTTLFQDSAGTTPVTAAGQPVGLMLDKSQGLVLGPELVTNGDFSNGSTGWTLGAGWSVSGGAASIDGTNSASSILTQNTISTVVGRTYRVSFSYSVTAGRIRLNTAQFGTTNSLSAGSSGVFSALLVSTSASGSFSIQAQDAGTVATVDNVSVKELPGNHATQSTAASRPTYRIDGTGRPYLSFDGIDDSMVTPTITPGIDKAQVFAGVRKLSDAARGIVVESSVTRANNNGAITMDAPGDAVAGVKYAFASKGTVDAFTTTTSTTFNAPITNVLTGIGDIAADVVRLRINGAQVSEVLTDQGTGNYLAYPLYIGRRGGTSLPFNGNLYGLITRFGANLTADQITAIESWMNTKTGAY